MPFWDPNGVSQEKIRSDTGANHENPLMAVFGETSNILVCVYIVKDKEVANSIP
jgi:hypothetical protein